MNPTGVLKVKSEKNCTVCGCKRNITYIENVYVNTILGIRKAKEKLFQKVNKPYTCKICKTIIKES